MSALRLGTRASALAMTQSRTVARALQQATGRTVELIEVTTFGDTSRAHLSEIGGTGVFAAALRRAVLDGQVDLAVHSFKDLPTAAVDGLVVAAVPPREDPRDVLVAGTVQTLQSLPRGARVGTGSSRRQAQLLALRPDLVVEPVRGNVDRRVGFVVDGTLDAVVLAHAGLRRLGRADAVSAVLEPEQMLPAPAQGALAVECRADDAQLVAAVAALDDPVSRGAVTAERALLATLEAGCTAPVGALATVTDDVLTLDGVVAATDGSVVLRRTVAGPPGDPASTGRAVAAQLIAAGADRLVADERSAACPVAGPPTTPEPTPRPNQPSPERAS